MKQTRKPFQTVKHPIGDGKLTCIYKPFRSDFWYFRHWVKPKQKYLWFSLRTKDVIEAKQRGEKRYLELMGKIDRAVAPTRIPSIPMSKRDILESIHTMMIDHYGIQSGGQLFLYMMQKIQTLSFTDSNRLLREDYRFLRNLIRRPNDA